MWHHVDVGLFSDRHPFLLCLANTVAWCKLGEKNHSLGKKCSQQGSIWVILFLSLYLCIYESLNKHIYELIPHTGTPNISCFFFSFFLEQALCLLVLSSQNNLWFLVLLRMQWIRVKCKKVETKQTNRVYCHWGALSDDLLNEAEFSLHTEGCWKLSSLLLPFVSALCCCEWQHLQNMCMSC